MTLFTRDDKIERVFRELETLVLKEYRDTVKEDAKEIAKELIEERGLDYVCRDIYDALAEADDLIHETADSRVTYTLDNELLLLFDPYPEREQVDFDIIKEVASHAEAEDVVGTTVQAYAYELWKVGIRNALEEILKEKCKLKKR